jgi:hypothetical protein
MLASVRRLRLALPLALVAAGAAMAPAALAAQRDDQPSPIARGPHVSGVAQRFAHQKASSSAATSATPSTCTTPGSTNYKLNCHGSGRPVNETWVATNGTQLVAGANDYNSYNGQGQNGFYWSSDGATWNDAGPIDVFPHNMNNGAGDPGLAIDSSANVYYSSLFFNFNRCNVGGVELLRKSASGSWAYTQIAANSNSAFQDKPAIAIDSSHTYVSWTQFGSCSGSGVPSPIKVAVFNSGPTGAKTATLSVPGSTYSQGSSIASDGSGGFWIAWEEYPSASASTGKIELAHYSSGSWSTPQQISPTGFTDLSSPLPGFSFRTDSFPALAVVGGLPRVAWTSYDTGTGRAYLWSATGPTTSTLTTLSPSGGDQFFPAISANGSGVYVSFSQVTQFNNGKPTGYDQFVWDGTSTQKVSTASSYPNNDSFFSGQFIGDYNGMATFNTAAHPVWTDIRASDSNYPGYEMDGMTSSPSATTSYRDTILHDNPALYWRLGEASGTTANDETTNNRNGTYVGSPTLGAPGALAGDSNTAVALNGSTQEITSTYSPFTNGTTRSYEGWAYRNTSSSYDALFGGTGTPYTQSGFCRLEPGSNDVTFLPDTNFGQVIWTNAWPGTGQWVHWALVYNESTGIAELFINGSSVGTRNTFGVPWAAGIGNFEAGAWTGNGDPFDGKLDEIAVYNYGLTSAQIAAHYQAGT